MIKSRFFTVVLLVVGAGIAAACTPGQPSSPPPAAVTTPTVGQPTAVASPSPASTSTAASTSTSAAQTQATRSATLPSTAGGTPIMVATIATAADAPGDPANVYSTAIRVSPAQPVAGPDYVTFYVTLNNSSGKSQALKWYVRIFSPASSTQSFGETAKQVNDVPPGTSEIATAANWRTNPIACEPYTARAYWLNSQVNFGNPVEFKKQDGSAGPVLNFQVCPATPKP